MGCHIFDLDGTLIYQHRQRPDFVHRWLPGAKAMLRRLLSAGESVLIITARNPADDARPWSIAAARDFLDAEGFPHVPLQPNMQALRVLYDDRQPHAVLHARDTPWTS